MCLPDAHAARGEDVEPQEAGIDFDELDALTTSAFEQLDSDRPGGCDRCAEIGRSEELFAGIAAREKVGVFDSRHSQGP
jgi:hypothetical protein